MKKIFLIYSVLCAMVVNCFAQVPAQQPYPVATASQNIAEVEAYVGNTDPGIGNGTPISMPTGVTDATVSNTTLNFTAQPNGVQFLYIRSRDVSGKWSLTNYKLFTVGNFNYPVAPALQNIAEVEAYVGNTDPGIGNGTPITIPTGTTNATATNTTLNFTAQPNGVQFLYIRSRDVSGKWSLSNYKLFTVGNFNYPVVPALQNIAEVEAYVGNTDPGIGNGTPITIPTGTTNATATNTTLNFTAQPNGVQFLYIRSRDVSGKWSLSNYKLFTVGNFNYPVAPALQNITKLEAYVGNTDPGIGNGAPITIPTGTTNAVVTNTTLNFTAQPNGAQFLYVRSRDASGKWSLTNYKFFTVGVFGYPLTPITPPNIGNLEYYVDTDPGFGNGTAITVPSNSTDVQLSNISISVSGTLANGNHVFHIRSKQNPWSIDNARSFSVGSVVPVTWLFVKAQVQANNALINWATAQEIDSKKFEIEWSTNGINFSNIGEVAAAGNASTITNYNFTHKNINNGFNYYRIKQIDNNGDYKYSAIVKVLFNKNLKQTIIAPNPVADVLQIVQAKAVFVKAISIIDSKGSIVLQKIINSKEQVISIPVSNLASGMYTLKMQYENEVLSYPFIKN
jgi:mannitol/fructose-specific phosphotransferase system IIA component